MTIGPMYLTPLSCSTKNKSSLGGNLLHDVVALVGTPIKPGGKIKFERFVLNHKKEQ
jgi:hypothetical protein